MHLYEIFSKYFENGKDAKAAVNAIETISETKISAMLRRLLTKDDKVDLIREMKSDKSELVEKIQSNKTELVEIIHSNKTELVEIIHSNKIGRASCREKSVSVRVDLGGRRIIKKKKVKT